MFPDDRFDYVIAALLFASVIAWVVWEYYRALRVRRDTDQWFRDRNELPPSHRHFYR